MLCYARIYFRLSLYINNNQLASYFSITRTAKKVKIQWQFGNQDSIDTICKYIEHLADNNNQCPAPVNKIFIYTCDRKIRDIKDFQKADSETIFLLNPLCVLKMAEKENVNLYNTLALAETGNAFGNIDV